MYWPFWCSTSIWVYSIRYLCSVYQTCSISLGEYLQQEHNTTDPSSIWHSPSLLNHRKWKTIDAERADIRMAGTRENDTTLWSYPLEDQTCLLTTKYQFDNAHTELNIWVSDCLFVTRHVRKAVEQVAKKICDRVGIDYAYEGIILPSYSVLARARICLGKAHLQLAQEIHSNETSGLATVEIDGKPKAMDCFLNSLAGSVSEGTGLLMNMLPLSSSNSGLVLEVRIAACGLFRTLKPLKQTWNRPCCWVGQSAISNSPQRKCRWHIS